MGQGRAPLRKTLSVLHLQQPSSASSWPQHLYSPSSQAHQIPGASRPPPCIRSLSRGRHPGHRSLPPRMAVHPLTPLPWAVSSSSLMAPTYISTANGPGCEESGYRLRVSQGPASSRLVGRLVGWLVGWSVGRLVGWSVGRRLARCQ